MLLTMESKTAAAHKLELLIERGRTKAGEVLDYVMNNQPADRIAQGGELVFTSSTDGSAVQIQYPDPQAGKALQRELGLEGPVIGFVGRLTAAKGLDVLMAALEKVVSRASGRTARAAQHSAARELRCPCARWS